MSPYTNCDLSDVTPLLTPWTEKGGLIQPVFSQEVAKRSLELAASAYQMNMADWRDAGWRDISYMTDNALLTGEAANGGSGGSFSAVMSDYYQRMAQARIKRMNPVTQVLGTLRQREGSDTCKAVILCHPAPGGRFVVAVGFMGTGKRVFDWISNFRLAHESGMHLGFLQLTQEFENNCDKILFPETARALGVDRLTLADILRECRRADSRFHLWMAGHSQGGAVMQLFAWREIQRGLLRQHMIGYGFASPSVLYENPGCDLSALPLYHLISADDVIPRVGAQLHIGKCRVIIPDAAMRAACYRPHYADPAFRAVQDALFLIRDSGSALLWVRAMLEALALLPGEESVSVINQLLGKLLPDRVLSALDGRMDGMIRTLIQKINQAYALSTGEDAPPEALILPLQLRLNALLARFGSRAFARALTQALALPHRLFSREPELYEASYQFTVNHRFHAARQRLWLAPAVTGMTARRPVQRRCTPRRTVHSPLPRRRRQAREK